jgi:hypothetical protein
VFKDLGTPIVDGNAKTYPCGCRLTLALLSNKLGAFALDACPFHINQLVLEAKALDSNEEPYDPQEA